MLATYLAAIADIRATDNEHTHRAALDALLRRAHETLTAKTPALKHIHITHEPHASKNGLGAPDFQLTLGAGGVRRAHARLRGEQARGCRLRRAHRRGKRR